MGHRSGDHGFARSQFDFAAACGERYSAWHRAPIRRLVGSKSFLAGSRENSACKFETTVRVLSAKQKTAFNPAGALPPRRGPVCRQTYGTDQHFEMVNFPQGGLWVTLILPARESPIPEQDEQAIEA